MTNMSLRISEERVDEYDGADRQSGVEQIDRVGVEQTDRVGWSRQTDSV